MVLLLRGNKGDGFSDSSVVRDEAGIKKITKQEIIRFLLLVCFPICFPLALPSSTRERCFVDSGL